MQVGRQASAHQLQQVKEFCKKQRYALSSFIVCCLLCFQKYMMLNQKLRPAGERLTW